MRGSGADLRRGGARPECVGVGVKYGTSLGDKVLYYVRTDNERVWDDAFMNFLNNTQILPLRPAPYAPAANGKVGRLVRQIVEGLRAILLHTDQRLWCYALEHWGLVWNDVHINKATGLTPNEEAECDLLKTDDPRRRSGRNAPGSGGSTPTPTHSGRTTRWCATGMRGSGCEQKNCSTRRIARRANKKAFMTAFNKPLQTASTR